MAVRPEISDTWKYALVGGLLSLPFTALEIRQSSGTTTFELFLFGSALAGYLVKRRGGDSTATGLRAGVIGGAPAVWILVELFRTVPTLPSPLWFQAVSVALLLGFGALVVLLLAVLGALAGRFGGWLAQRAGHGGPESEGGTVR